MSDQSATTTESKCIQLLDTLGFRLMHARTIAGMTQYTAGRISGYSHSTIMHWERAHVSPRVDAVWVMARTYGVSAGWLLGFDQDQFATTDSVSARILAAMLVTGTGVRPLGKAVGVTPGIVSRWRRGQSVPRTTRIPDIARTLDVSDQYLVPSVPNQGGY